MTTAATKPPSPFEFTQLPDNGGTVIRPWLNNAQRQAVQKCFRTKLTFTDLIDENKKLVGTKVFTWIGESDWPRVKDSLAGVKLWTPAIAPVKRTYPTKLASVAALDPPRIVFAINAYLKYMFMCRAHGGTTEVAGYGVHRRVGTHKEVIYVHDFVTVRHKEANAAFCSLDTDHANDLAVEMAIADPNFNPNDLLAVWCHTHPGNDVTPSGTDWDTFDEHDSADWAAMVILGKDGRLGAHVRQKGALYSPILGLTPEVDYSGMGKVEIASKIRPAEWEAEYVANIAPAVARGFSSSVTGAWSSNSATWPAGDADPYPSKIYYYGKGTAERDNDLVEQRELRKLEEAYDLERELGDRYDLTLIKDDMTDDELLDAAFDDDEEEYDPVNIRSAIEDEEETLQDCRISLQNANEKDAEPVRRRMAAVEKRLDTLRAMLRDALASAASGPDNAPETAATPAPETQDAHDLAVSP